MSFIHFVRANWLFLLAGFTLTVTSSYGQTFFISLFAGQIMADFGLSNGQWGGIYTLGTTASAITMVWAGTLVDRFRVRALGTWYCWPWQQRVCSWRLCRMQHCWC